MSQFWEWLGKMHWLAPWCYIWSMGCIWPTKPYHLACSAACRSQILPLCCVKHALAQTPCATCSVWGWFGPCIDFIVWSGFVGPISTDPGFNTKDKSGSGTTWRIHPRPASCAACSIHPEPAPSTDIAHMLSPIPYTACNTYQTGIDTRPASCTTCSTQGQSKTCKYHCRLLPLADLSYITMALLYCSGLHILCYIGFKCFKSKILEGHKVKQNSSLW